LASKRLMKLSFHLFISCVFVDLKGYVPVTKITIIIIIIIIIITTTTTTG